MHSGTLPHAPAHARRFRAGAALVETLAAIAILLIVSAMVTAVLIAELRARARVIAASTASTSAQHGIRTIREHLAAAVRILPSATINGVPITTGPTAIAFEVPTVTAAGARLMTRDRVGVAVVGNRLELHIDPAAGSRLLLGTRTIARSVDAFRIRYVAPTPTAARIAHFILTNAETFAGHTARASHVTVVRFENIP